MKTKAIVALCVTAMQIQAGYAQGNNSVGNFVTGGATVELVEHAGTVQSISKPERIVIHDFAVPADLITLDNSIVGRLHRKRLLKKGEDDDSTPEVLAQHVRTVFAKALADQLEKDHAAIVVARGSDAIAEGSGARLVVDGAFTTIDEGNRTTRKLIGFGSGESDIKTHVTVSSIVAGRASVVLAFDLDSNSGKAPGKVATMGINSQAAGAAIGVLGDMGTTVDSDASRMAKLVAKQIESLTGAPATVVVPSPAGGGTAVQTGHSAG